MIDAADAGGLSELAASEVWEEAMSKAKEQVG
jgi:hypothetical protein